MPNSTKSLWQRAVSACADSLTSCLKSPAARAAETAALDKQIADVLEQEYKLPLRFLTKDELKHLRRVYKKTNAKRDQAEAAIAVAEKAFEVGIEDALDAALAKAEADLARNRSQGNPHNRRQYSLAKESSKLNIS